ncbi:lysosome-associated membrane glycoprotein 3 isoform X2 [Pezoporus flaviventris]|uniref:lysosome-associated membrane glycoprotein 3 isoform X2 n=1 Tax=Pezoporus flaviventris TaxID=889875 RepID=UPI002AB2A79D|nr:lysosome-associated membrane glycoprotein 3 isoform X2 [Pezoporus flaviventris]
MGRSKWQFILLAFTCAFSSCFAEVALGVKVSPETVSFPHTATSQPHPRHHSSSHQGTTVRFNSAGSLKTTSMSHRTTVQSTDQRQVTTAPGHHTTDQAAATTTQVISQKSPMVVSTISADNTTAAGQTTTQAMETVTLVKNATTHPVSSTKQDRACVSAEITAAATNTTIKHTTPNTQMTAIAINTTAATMQTVKPTTGSGNQTTLPESSIAPAMTNATTIHPGTRTAIPSTMMTTRPTLAPQPSPIPTGIYTISSGNRTCIKAVMGLQLMAQNAQKKQMEYMTVIPNVTQTFGSCGMVQSELNITFSGGFVNFTFVKQAPSYYVSKIETRLQSSSEGMLYYGAIQEKMFTTKLGNSFKCASKQTFNLEKNFQLLFVNMQLQAFDIVGNQFGKAMQPGPDQAVGPRLLGVPGNSHAPHYGYSHGLLPYF